MQPKLLGSFPNIVFYSFITIIVIIVFVVVIIITINNCYYWLLKNTQTTG